ncbi:putative membrane protein SirB2 [Crenobacter luteus]|uniref:SirB2 family protein n=1 Tax=Crenobacter luteus TaxID=1452487 RepID=UPI001042E657|nr:SirB2 family protein [Crenobacter luteus]TCP10928.1 putative membrane protein SirB2 [Crenobacter luteus]
MSIYASVKHAHVALAALTAGLFLARGFLAAARPAALGQRWLRVAPHLVDTALLACGATLAWLAPFNPASSPWLAAKLAAVLAFIGLGAVALKPSRPAPLRAAAFACALATLGYIAAVAVGKSPLPF